MISIYVIHDDSDTSKRLYIGLTRQTVHRRFGQHISEATRENGHKSIKNDWLKSLVIRGLKPSVLLLESVPDDEGSNAESFWIQYFSGLGFQLANGTSGGEIGFQPSAEALSRLSAALKARAITHVSCRLGAKHSDETKRKMSIARKGYVVPDDVRKRTSETLKILFNTPEMLEQFRKRQTGTKHTEETKAKMSASGKGRVLSAETRNKISQAKKGRKGKPRSPETIEKIRKSNIETWKRKLATAKEPGD